MREIDFVTFGVAIVLEKAGYNLPSFGRCKIERDEDGVNCKEFWIQAFESKHYNVYNLLSVPRLDDVITWLREEHGIYTLIFPDINHDMIHGGLVIDTRNPDQNGEPKEMASIRTVSHTDAPHIGGTYYEVANEVIRLTLVKMTENG